MRVALPALVVLLLAPAARPGEPPAVAVVTIAGALDASHVALVSRAARKIRQERPALIVFEIDTPGGRIDHMLRMGEEMMSLQPIPTAAWVRPVAGGDITGGAWSAGAFLALCCKRLYMYPGTVIGAAAPVAQTAEGVKPVDEKYVSAFREKFRARAEQNGYPANLAVAMVDEDLEVFEVTVGGRKMYLTEGEIEKLRRDNQEVEKPTVPFVAKGKLLTLTDRQVVETGMGQMAESLQVILEDHGLRDVSEKRFGPSWSETLVGFLTSPIVSFILLLLGILGIWVELKTPGFGAAGAIGIGAFALLLFGHHLAGLAEVPEILLFAAGIALVLVEILLVPGTFLPAIAGAICILAGLILSLQDFTLPRPKEAPWEVDILFSSVGRVLVAFAGASAGFLAIMRFLPQVPLLNRLVLQAEIAGAAPSHPAGGDLLGRMGRAVTPLHPGGKIEIDGEVHDVVAEGDFIEKGETIEVLRIEGLRIVVGKVKR